MKKFKLLLLAVCSLWGGFAVQAQKKFVSAAPTSGKAGIIRGVKDQGEGKVLYGYCSEDFRITSQTGVGFNTDEDVEVAAAIRLSEGMTNLLKGRQIYRLRVGVASNTEAEIFLRNADGTTLRQITRELVLGWNEIVLETPWEIPEEKEIYIGYSCIQHPKEFVIAVSNASSKANGLFISADNMSLVEYTGLGNLCLLIEVDGSESEFGYVGSVASAYASNPYLCEGAGESSEVSLNFLNEGENNVSTIKLGRTFNNIELGDTVCTFKRTLRANSIGELTLKVVPEETGRYVFTLKEMGETPVIASTKTVDFSFYKREQVVPRTVLMEEFTSQQCGNCPSGQSALHNAIAGYEDRVALVLHHSGYYPDAFSIAESDVYCYFYNSASTYAPAMTMDRTYLPEYDRQGTGSPVFDPRSLKQARFLKQLELPAMVTVGIASAYDEATRKLTVTVSGYRITNLIGEHVGLTVFLLESKYMAYQSGGGTNFEHNNFPRYVLSDVEGDVITFNGNNYSKTYTYTIPESYISIKNEETVAHPENMHIVAFVSNFDRRHPDNCVVLNANKTSSLNDVVSGMEMVKAVECPLRLFVRDGRICAGGEYEIRSVYNLQGISVRNEALKPGIYLVKATGTDQQEYVGKIVVR